ncbi:hypothetical protein RVBP16_3950 [Pseudomonas phage sp. 30-2]|nr:hypothetical protein RVBP16_3950 [Pseudomonas phage sp. 30-2]
MVDFKGFNWDALVPEDNVSTVSIKNHYEELLQSFVDNGIDYVLVQLSQELPHYEDSDYPCYKLVDKYAGWIVGWDYYGFVVERMDTHLFFDNGTAKGVMDFLEANS